MTTEKSTLVIRWPSGQSIICGEMTDHQHGEICRILSPDYRAHPIQGGEAVEVVSYRGKDPDGGEGFVGARWPDAFGEDCIVEPLMTVAQHQRILAAATHPAEQVADGVTVSRKRI